jgi:hypothetical protein
MRWYITATAVKEYQEIAGLPIESDGQSFDRAERELAEICDDATLAKAAGEANRNAAIYKAKTTVRGKIARLELYVAEYPRPEGPLAQLVRVRFKGGARTGRRR